MDNADDKILYLPVYISQPFMQGSLCQAVTGKIYRL